jgi:twitching motility protein PilJ
MDIPNLLPLASINKTSVDATSEAHPEVAERAEADGAGPEHLSVASPPVSEQADPAPNPPQDASQIMVSVPGIGTRSVRAQRRLLSAVLALSLVVVLPAAIYKLQLLNMVAQQIAVTGQALTQSQRLAKSVTQALMGNPLAFVDIAASTEVLSKSTDALEHGDGGMRIQALPAEIQPALRPALALVAQAQKSSMMILDQQKVLEQIGVALARMNRQSEDWLELTKTISSMKQQQGASPGDISAVGELSTLTQRIGKSTNEFLNSQGASPEAVFLLGKDLNAFKDISQGLLEGSADLRLTATQDKATRDKLVELIAMFEEIRSEAGAILNNLQVLMAVRQAQAGVISDSEPLREHLEALQDQLAARAKEGLLATGALAPLALLVLLSGLGLAYVQVQESRIRQGIAEAQRQAAQQSSETANQAAADVRRINDSNQAAILRLMNELLAVAGGDLTREATVSEDITGALADSVNYTVEELRSLIASVQGAAERVNQTTAVVGRTSQALLAASDVQLKDIREAGRSVVEMSGRITDVSAQAQESALVARQSLQAAESGLLAVQSTIGGMNTIREQIQETSKRIKRLGESSQEIGEITDLISDITEQTNVLALNAAIQAASAGEAGRGFSVVAEEVQRLAERSADATRQIAVLVKMIQTDAQNAMGAMERSAQGVVAGAQLSDNAGEALTEIDRISRQVADQIVQISGAASREAELASGVAQNIQLIFAETEKTADGTRATASQVRELSHTAQELSQSVARFKLA